MKKPRFDLAKLQPRIHVQGVLKDLAKAPVLDFDEHVGTTEKFVTIAVPFCTTEDGRKYLTARQLAENPYLRDFVDRFRDCFTFDMRSYTYWFEEKKPDEGESRAAG